jgi:hypothetical protein
MVNKWLNCRAASVSSITQARETTFAGRSHSVEFKNSLATHVRHYCCRDLAGGGHREKTLLSYAFLAIAYVGVFLFGYGVVGHVLG